MKHNHFHVSIRRCVWPVGAVAQALFYSVVRYLKSERR